MGVAHGTLRNQEGFNKIIVLSKKSPDIISVVIEYLADAEQILKLRQVSKAFDTAVYRVRLFKHRQSTQMVNYLTALLKRVEDLDLQYIRIHLGTLEKRMRRIYKKVNTL